MTRHFGHHRVLVRAFAVADVVEVTCPRTEMLFARTEHGGTDVDVYLRTRVSVVTPHAIRGVFRQRPGS